MRVDVEVTLGLDAEIESSVTRELVQHVIEHADAGGNLSGASAVEVERDLDGRLFGTSFDAGGAVRVTHAITVSQDVSDVQRTGSGRSIVLR